jgi:hypothetical protein
MNDSLADLEQDLLERPGEFFISLGIDAGASRFKDIHLLCLVKTPNTIILINIYPVYRLMFNTSWSESYNSFWTLKKALKIMLYKLNQI